MMSWCKLSAVVYRSRVVTSLAAQLPRHDRIFESRQFCWRRQCLLGRLSSSHTNSNTKHQQNHPRMNKNVFQNIHPSAYKVASSKLLQNEDIPSSELQNPWNSECSFDDTESEHYRKADKVPTNHVLIYMVTGRRYARIVNTIMKFSFVYAEGLCAYHLYNYRQSVTNLDQALSAIANPHITLSVIGLLTFPIGMGLCHTDSRKHIIRIYKENVHDKKYIAIKPYWFFWTKQFPFTGEEVKYVADWEDSLYGIVAGNVALKRTRHRIIPSSFKELSWYNEFCGFGPTSFQKVKK